ncbi:hypothetical protein, partial [Rhodococcus sp. 27YEA6]|uniref:hypothetical protein n=1 Tax=Rhodococcus sp. 27YEA6 TaxID=3156273 RepID=UPI003833941C
WGTIWPYAGRNHGHKMRHKWPPVGSLRWPSTDGALVISCDIKKSNQLAESFSEYGNRFTASLDLKQAKKTLLGYGEYDYGNTPWSKTTPAQQESTSVTAPPDKYREVTSTWKPASQSTSTA